MAGAVPLRFKNSTTGRSVIQTALLRAAGLGLRAFGAVQPRRADEIALGLWSRPMLGGQPKPPRAGADLEAHEFEVAVFGRKLAVWDWGRGPTVLLAHGWNGHAGQLSPFVAPLVASGHYVVAFDQPAHARSEGKHVTLFDMAEALAVLTRRLGPVKAVIAHSLGATATALALSQGLPVDRAVLIAPPAEVPHFLGGFARALGLGEKRTAGLFRAMEERFGPLDDFDLRKLAPRLRAQALVLHDPADREVPFEHGRSIAEAWPGARLEQVQRLGHRRILADEAVVRRAVAFVSEQSVPRRIGGSLRAV